MDEGSGFVSAVRDAVGQRNPSRARNAGTSGDIAWGARSLARAMWCE
jgi:hypothetical protein